MLRFDECPVCDRMVPVEDGRFMPHLFDVLFSDLCMMSNSYVEDCHEAT